MPNSFLPIQRLLAIDLAIHDSAVWLPYLSQGFGLQRIGTANDAAIERTGTRQHVMACGPVRLNLYEPVRAGSPVRRYLERHPEGIWRVSFLVDDVGRVTEQLAERQAALLSDVETTELSGGGAWKSVAIATPIGDVEYAFVQIEGDAAAALGPGIEPVRGVDRRQNPLGIEAVDHLTVNARTLMPLIAFHEHVMGFKQIRELRFHSDEIRPGLGTGLRSVVVGDETGAVRLALNEPLRPRFEQSQVQLCVDMNRGPGLQHVALRVADIFRAVDTSASAGVQFLPTPTAYYRAMPDRLRRQGVSPPATSLEALAGRGILVDGDRHGAIMQIFCRDQATQFGRPNAGPVFFEFIQRCGGQGFGEGNFRALFDAAQSPQEFAVAERG